MARPDDLTEPRQQGGPIQHGRDFRGDGAKSKGREDALRARVPSPRMRGEGQDEGRRLSLQPECCPSPSLLSTSPRLRGEVWLAISARAFSCTVMVPDAIGIRSGVPDEVYGR
jgi:hypothetical protein